MSGACASAGKWRARISRARRSCSGDRDAVAVDVEAVGALEVRAHLHAAAVDVADAVGGGRVVDPRRHAGRPPRRARPEVEDVLLGDPQVDEAREQPRQPRAAGPDDAVGLEPPAVVEHDRRTVGARLAQLERRPGPHRLLGQRAGRVARLQDAGLGLPQPPRDVVAGEARKAARRIDPRAGDLERPHRLLARRLPAVVVVGEPEHARGDDERRVDLVPQRPGPARRRRVPLVLAVPAADDPRLVARPGPDVTGGDALDERDVPVPERAPARE